MCNRSSIALRGAGGAGGGAMGTVVTTIGTRAGAGTGAATGAAFFLASVGSARQSQPLTFAALVTFGGLTGAAVSFPLRGASNSAGRAAGRFHLQAPTPPSIVESIQSWSYRCAPFTA